MSGPTHHTKVLVLGMDGLDPRRIRHMVHEGQLPAFARLHAGGTLSPLATSNPAESPVAWSSLATGCNPGKHGIFDFIHRNPSGYVPYLSLIKEQRSGLNKKGADRFACPRAMPGFWRLTSDAGLPTTVIRWPVTFPAEPVTGRFLAGLGVPDVTGRLGKYTYYTTAPVNDADEKVVPVTWRGNTATTSLFGPPMAGLRGSRPLTAKLRIERTPTGVALTVGSQQLGVACGRWSDWLTVNFKYGPMRVCSARVKFHLVSVEPNLRLFATPLQIDPEHQIWPLTQPQTYGAELARTIGPYYTLGLPEDTNAVTDGRYDLDAFLQQCAEIDRQRRAMFDHELHRFDDGVLAFVFDAGDRVQHMFWSIQDETSPTYDAVLARKYAGVIDDLYRQMDGVLAAALDRAGDDTAVFVVSDHGFGPFRRAVHVNRWLVDHGYMTLKNADEGRSLLADVDWSQTKAYAVGFTSIYLNIAGRESDGIVQPGEDAEILAREISERLGEAKDPASGDPAVRRVYLTSDIYHGPSARLGPDLVVGFEPGYRASWQTALGAAPHETVIDNDKAWAADHLVDPSAVPGVLASNVEIACADPAGIDLTPTILNCLGLPTPENMDGRSWLDETEPKDQARTSETAAELEPVAALVPDTAADGLDDTQRAELEQHLSDLGYL